MYDLSTTQCSKTADCEARGGEFVGTICESGVCVTPASSSGGGGGADGTGGNGEGGMAECETNVECIKAAFQSPAICREGTCLNLTSGFDCPLVLGAGEDNRNLIDGDPIVIGAYSYVDPISPLQSAPTLNYKLAIDEFNERTLGGLPGGQDGKLRPIVAVICGGTDSPNFEASGEHLIDNLRVPAVIASVYTHDLLRLFLAQGKPNGVLFLSPLGADSTLENAEDDGLLWHMLGGSKDLTPILLPLVSKVEEHVRTQHDIPDSTALRVALVEAKTPFESDLAEYIYSSVPLNGKSARLNEQAGTFLRLRVDSELEESDPDLSEAYSALLNFAPHIILSMTSGEITKILPNLETNWDSAKAPPPFYVLSPDLFGNSNISGFVELYAAGRVLGFNDAGATNPALYDSYFSRLTLENNVTFPLEGTENYYDATYFLLHAIAGVATAGDVTGAALARELPRLMTGEQEYAVGPQAIGDILKFLKMNPDGSLRLEGTMGPPDFHLDTGVRTVSPSVYCIGQDGVFEQDAMRLDATMSSLVGTPSCVPGFPQ
jgi:hypothetical protein